MHVQAHFQRDANPRGQARNLALAELGMTELKRLKKVAGFIHMEVPEVMGDPQLSTWLFQVTKSRSSMTTG